ncbi:MFS transporter [Protaetiibacter sp. WY-16]|uniref:MFS transporter n=1 Tax=Antiquaquibacter soli TaxID=3064523 RepID=A0ABT9BP10_9MICO|nr:MFS transporter [Protaetiibacter sp. WY-16]MDO7881155.1 MFS transporter [Protaetiibacter sp. WY-16]
MTPLDLPLRRNRNFLWFWGGEAVSQLGAQFTLLAIPVLAVTFLGATEWQVGLLGAAQTAAFLLVGLPAGAWLDRMLKRRAMIAADIVRAAALATLPALWFAGHLEMWHLYVVGIVVGVATVFFDVAYQSYVPILLPSSQIGSGNSRLETTSQIASIGGPGLAGALLTIVSAPVLLVVDAISYVVSAFAIWRVRDTETTPPRHERRPLATEIAEGIAFVFRHRLLRAIVLTTAATNFFGFFITTLEALYVLRELDLGPASLGLMYSVGSVGGLLGAVATPWFTRLIGEGTAITVSAIGFGIATAAYPLASLAGVAALPVLIGGMLLQSFFVLVYNITQVTMRQRLCPPRLLGRMNASIRFVVWGVMPLGSLAGGALGTGLGIVPTMWIGTVGGLLGAAFVLFSPLTGMRELPREQVRD